MLTPERRVELRRRIRFSREMGRTDLPIAFDDDITDLLDAADEADRLRTWQKRVAFACQSYVDLVDERDRLASLLDEVRDQVRRGALCPMCSTGMTRQTVGMVCQLCGTDYGKR